MFGKISLLIFAFGCITASAQQGQDILENYFEAKGGKKKLKNIKTMDLELTSDNPRTGKAQINYWYKAPNMMKIESKIGAQKNIVATNGDVHWYIPPMQGGAPQKLQGAQASMIDNQLQIFKNLIIGIDPDMPGTEKIQYDGEEDMDGMKVHHLKLTDSTGNIQNAFFNKKSGFLEKVTIQSTGANGEQQIIKQVVEKRMQSDGIYHPEIYKIYQNDQLVQTFTIKKVELDKSIDESIFDMPSKK